MPCSVTARLQTLASTDPYKPWSTARETFYNIGYIGGTLAIAWALAVQCPDLPVVTVDGDQNAQMSAFHENLAAHYPRNLTWYILDNGIGASVGTAQSVPLSTHLHTPPRTRQRHRHPA